MWQMLKGFVKGPTCTTMKLEERHVLAAVKYQNTEYVWITRTEAIIMFQGHVWEPSLEVCSKVPRYIEADETPPARANPRDDDFKMYKILKTTTEGPWNA